MSDVLCLIQAFKWTIGMTYWVSSLGLARSYTNIHTYMYSRRNDIGAPKIQNDYGAIELRYFSTAPCKCITLNLICFILE